MARLYLYLSYSATVVSANVTYVRVESYFWTDNNVLGIPLH